MNIMVETAVRCLSWLQLIGTGSNCR